MDLDYWIISDAVLTLKKLSEALTVKLEEKPRDSDISHLSVSAVTVTDGSEDKLNAVVQTETNYVAACFCSL